jgi:PAS domain S-box-containing protein
VGMESAKSEAISALQSVGSHPIFAFFPGAMLVFDRQLRFLSAGGSGLGDVGLSRALIEGHTLQEVFPPDVAASLEPAYRQALTGHESSVDIPYGDRIYVQRIVALYDGNGEIIAGMGLTRDATEARRSERELEEAQLELVQESRRLRDAQSLGRLGSWEWNAATGAYTWSDSLFELYGLDPDGGPLDLRSGVACIHPDDQERVETALRTCLRTGQPFRVRYRVTRADDGVERHFEGGCDVEHEQGQITRVVGAVADITELVTAEMEATEARTFLEAVHRAAPDQTFVLDLTTGMTTYTSQDEDPLGITRSRALALKPDEVVDLLHPEDRDSIRLANLNAVGLEDGEVLFTRFRARHVDGGWRWLSRRVTPFRRDQTGRVVEIIGSSRDVTHIMEAEEKLTHAALHDTLTGLPNRALLMDRLGAALSRSRRDGREVAVLFCDLDGFKRVNDTAGHAAGDAVLLETTSRLQGVLREGDTVARVGGDEFVILVEPWNRPNDARGDANDPNGDVHAGPAHALALQVADRVLDALRQPIAVGDISHVVTVSIGVATTLSQSHDGRPITADAILQDADAAMYRAKAMGKDRFEIFENGLRDDLAERGRVEQVLRRALPSHAGWERYAAVPMQGPGAPTLSAAYQPIFASDTGQLVGFEALARLTDAGGTHIPADVFIAVAEDTGLIGSLGGIMLDLACGQLAAWRAEFPGLEQITMAVNVSAIQARFAALVGDVHSCLTAHGLAATDLVLELTETTLLQAAPSTITTLRDLRSSGVGIAIDDFGTGYASLRYLTTLPVSALKVDKSFTAGLPDDDTSRKIVKAVAGLAADLDLDCIVEGVETTEQCAALPAGVQLQGWLTGRPEPAYSIDVLRLVTQGAPFKTRTCAADTSH